MVPTVLTYQYVQSIDNANNLSHTDCNKPWQAYVVFYDMCIIHLGTKCNSDDKMCCMQSDYKRFSQFEYVSKQSKTPSPLII
jgi:hypothetical protein